MSSRKNVAARAVFDKPSAILLDIEGTTTDISFVSKTLFPFIKSNIGRYMADCYDTPETREMIQRLRDSRKSNTDLPSIAAVGESKSLVVRSATDYALAHIQLKRRISEIKQLQILVWVWGYERGILKGHVYDEVTTCMHIWKYSEEIRIYIFSSGMISAQQLLLCCTNHGNCLPLITDFFDSTVGEKSDPKSYLNISGKIDIPVENILFVTDSPKEAKAAVDSNCKACIIKRPNNKIRGLDDICELIPVVSTFDEIKFR